MDIGKEYMSLKDDYKLLFLALSTMRLHNGYYFFIDISIPNFFITK